jgi:hypothetical protein
MSEASQVNAAVRENLGHLGLWRRMEHSIEAGWADWYYIMRRRHGWLECKLAPANGKPPAHLTIDQLLWAEEELRWGGRWHLLALRQPRTWLLYDFDAACHWHAGTANQPILEVMGDFPVKEIISCLAPN